MINHPDRISGVFRGIRICETSIGEPTHRVGEEYFDGELCGLDEFEIIKR